MTRLAPLVRVSLVGRSVRLKKPTISRFIASWRAGRSKPPGLAQARRRRFQRRGKLATEEVPGAFDENAFRLRQGLARRSA